MSDMRRREFITLLGGAAAATTVWPFGTRAQQRLDRVRRIAVLMGVANDSQGQERVRAFRQGFQAAGWADGPNVQIDYHWVGGDADRARAYAAEVVALQPDVILANGTSVVAALQRETRTVPIVFVLGLDPVESGFVAGLAQPGGNVTNSSPRWAANGLRCSKRLRPASGGSRS